MSAVDGLVAAIAAHGLTPFRPIATEPLADPAFALLLAGARSERIVGHLVSAIESGALAATGAQYTSAGEAHEDALAVDLVLERLLVETSTELTHAGIAHRALKGAVVAHSAYPDPALRSFGDVDILVAGPQFDDAISLLVGHGGRRRYREPRPHFTARFGKGVCVVTPIGYEVDVHRVFVAGPFGLAIDPADLFATQETVTMGGVGVPALDATLRFLHACYHAGLGSRRPRLSALRDVAQTVQHADFDRARALDLAARWHGRAVVQRALRLTEATLPIDLDPTLMRWASSYAPDRFETTALSAYASNRASYAAQAVTGVWAIRGMRARASYVRALLFPTRAYVDEREGTYARRWRRGIALARRWRPVR